MIKEIFIFALAFFLFSCTGALEVTNPSGETENIVIEKDCVRIIVPPKATYCLNDMNCFVSHMNGGESVLWTDDDCKGDYAEFIDERKGTERGGRIYYSGEMKIYYGTFDGEQKTLQGKCGWVGDIHESGLLDGARTPKDICCKAKRDCGRIQ